MKRFEGCLTGLVVGDALGQKLTGQSTVAISTRYGDRPDLGGVEPDRYGASSQMAMAIASSLAECSGFDGADMASRLLGAYDPSRDYGKGTTAALRRLDDGAGWFEAGAVGGGRENFGNGAASRSAPIGLLYGHDTDTLRWVAEESAGITHQHALATEGAVLCALAVALAIAAEGKDISGAGFLAALREETQMREFGSRLETATAMAGRCPGATEVVERLGNNATALGSVVTAIWCFAEHPASFENAVIRCLSLGGNAAARTAMTGAIAGAYLGIDALPPRWLESLRWEALSRGTIERLAARLQAEAETLGINP